VASLSACQVKPGEYRIYKITSLPPVTGADCGADIDPRDYTTFFGAQTIQVFATDADDFFLEYGDAVITGTRSGTDYSFRGELVDVMDPDDDTTVTTTKTLDIALSIKGYKLTGEFVEFNSTVCGGNCDAFNNTQCTISGSFIGAELKDAELERPI
jgi:hypothetical protein